jgi:hypothetical protein
MDWGALSALDLSAAGLLAIGVLLIMMGQLVPRRIVTDLRTDRDARIVEARSETDDWKAAYHDEHEARRLQGEQIGELLELAKTQDQFIRSLQNAKKVDP